MKTQLNKNYKSEHSLFAIIQRLRISKQKTIDITQFEAEKVEKVMHQLLISPLNQTTKI